ncbi:MAG: bi-domain-containing oxidoreductase [Acidobacteriota bacterium]|nr:bi-domain-containing oxidoreductase [Acidobacteriota bacterium]
MPDGTAQRSCLVGYPLREGKARPLMKQLIQSASTGELALLEVPVPDTPRGGILVRTQASLVSAGTERSMVTFGEKNLLQKARSRPDLVQQTIEKARRDGILDTIDTVRNRLEQPSLLGYSAAGVVIDAGPESGFRTGDRVACAGAGIASHAQILAVPRNLALRLPDEVSFEEGAFCTVGAIALHGIRLAAPQLGEVTVVIGLGLLGQLAIQMLRASGCIVLGTDPQESRVALAISLGAQWAGTDVAELAARVAALSSGKGADAVYIAADTPSNQPVELAAEVARSRGTVISIGNVGTDLPRKPYFEKELAFRVSRSYGPGRYDDDYERKGHDYPHDYVRWTENRNMQAFATMVASGSVQLAPLITHRFDIEQGIAAYDVVLGRANEPFLGVMLQYGAEPELSRRIAVAPAETAKPEKAASVNVGVLGAGLFANGTLIPAMQKTDGVRLVAISSAGGVSARAAADRFGFSWCATSSDEILGDASINTVAIVTRPDLHTRQVVAALRAGKHVFVEKPLCLTEEELSEIVEAYGAADRMLMVGYNRRFAPFVVELRESLRNVAEPVMLTCRVNGGFIPPQHWVHDPAQGGGRLRGEGCHFIDLLIHLAGERVQRVRAVALPDSGRYRGDNFQVTLEFVNGSAGTVTYVANGARAFGKESIEAFGGGLAARLDDYRSLQIQHGTRAIRRTAHLRQDKGHRAEWEAIARHITAGAPAPIAFEEITHSTRATLAAWESLNRGEAVGVG